MAIFLIQKLWSQMINIFLVVNCASLCRIIYAFMMKSCCFWKLVLEFGF